MMYNINKVEDMAITPAPTQRQKVEKKEKYHEKSKYQIK